MGDRVAKWGGGGPCPPPRLEEEEEGPYSIQIGSIFYLRRPTQGVESKNETDSLCVATYSVQELTATQTSFRRQLTQVNGYWSDRKIKHRNPT